jgi:hypothetical protein
MTTMTAYFERFRKLKDRHGEDPKFKGGAAAIRQARISSSVVLGVMTIVMGTLVADIFSGPFAHLQTHQFRDSRNLAMKDVAPPPKANDVKIVSAKPKLDVPCEQQTWPYIDRRCLTESTRAPARTASGVDDRSPWRGEGKRQRTNTGPFDPRTAAAAAAASPPRQAAATTDGVASPDRKAVQSQATEARQATSAAASMASAGEAQHSSPGLTGNASMQAGTSVPLPVARPAIAASAVPATADDQSPTAGATTDDRQEAREEKPRRRASSRRNRGKSERIVRRWRELIYDPPDDKLPPGLTFPRGLF